MKNLKNYLDSQLQPFDRALLYSNIAMSPFFYSVFKWMFSAITLVLLTQYLSYYITVSYINLAISEAISPHLWNVLGTIGMSFLGLIFLFPSTTIANSIHGVFDNTYKMGLFSLGILIGQFIILFPSTLEKLDFFHQLLLIITVFIALIYIFFLNFSMYYLAKLVTSKNLNGNFLFHIQKLDFPLKVFGSLIFYLPLLLIYIFKI